MSNRIVWRAVLESTPLVLGVIAFLVCVIAAPHRLDDNFLNAAVQIVPFLLLALALETRLLSLTERRFEGDEVEEPETHVDRLLVAMIRFGRRLGAIYAVVMLIWAETAGLIALDSAGEHHWLGPYLLAAIVAGMVIVGAAALMPRR
jgi:chromosome condensin MukBEF MukE localization factor